MKKGDRRIFVYFRSGDRWDNDTIQWTPVGEPTEFEFLRFDEDGNEIWRKVGDNYYCMIPYMVIDTHSVWMEDTLEARIKATEAILCIWMESIEALEKYHRGEINNVQRQKIRICEIRSNYAKEMESDQKKIEDDAKVRRVEESNQLEEMENGFLDAVHYKHFVE